MGPNAATIGPCLRLCHRGRAVLCCGMTQLTLALPARHLDIHPPQPKPMLQLPTISKCVRLSTHLHTLLQPPAVLNGCPVPPAAPQTAQGCDHTLPQCSACAPQRWMCGPAVHSTNISDVSSCWMALLTTTVHIVHSRTGQWVGVARCSRGSNTCH